MNAVADIFDLDKDGFIDYQEFMTALRPDRVRAGVSGHLGGVSSSLGRRASRGSTDEEKIMTELKRQISHCTCCKQFMVIQVGDGKYRVSYFLIKKPSLILFKSLWISWDLIVPQTFFFNVRATVFRWKICLKLFTSVTFGSQPVHDCLTFFSKHWLLSFLFVLLSVVAIGCSHISILSFYSIRTTN